MSKESGVLLHITSLPGKYGIGTIGKNAYKFVDFLSETGFSYWEILPILATGFSNSPYHVTSAFGFNYYLIDLELIIDDGLLSARDLSGIDFGSNPRKVDFDALYKVKKDILYLAYKRFKKNEDLEFEEFLKKDHHAYDFALYSTIKYKNHDKGWFDFSLEDRYFSKEVKVEYENSEKDLIRFHGFVQYVFLKQWKKLKEYANSKNIDIIGDIPHFLGYDSDSMYMNPELFLVDKRNLVTSVAGFPPDEFRKEGQKWGFPLYDWEYMGLRNYKWWNERIYSASQLFDRIKLNHFRGFKKVYAVPFRAKNARKGKYLEGPGVDYIKELSKDYSIISSDLGTFSEEINEFVKETGVPNLRVLLPNLFSRNHFYEDVLPSNINSNSYCYLENHDYMPIRGLLEDNDQEKIQMFKERVFQEATNMNIEYNSNLSNFEFSRLLIEILFKSNASHVTLNFQDIIYGDKTTRMNAPGVVDSKNNWAFRFLNHDLDETTKEFLKKMNEKYVK